MNHGGRCQRDRGGGSPHSVFQARQRHQGLARGFLARGVVSINMDAATGRSSAWSRAVAAATGRSFEVVLSPHRNVRAIPPICAAQRRHKPTVHRLDREYRRSTDSPQCRPVNGDSTRRTLGVGLSRIIRKPFRSSPPRAAFQIRQGSRRVEIAAGRTICPERPELANPYDLIFSLIRYKVQVSPFWSGRRGDRSAHCGRSLLTAVARLGN